MPLTAAKIGKPQEMPATLDLNESQLPSIKDWQIGKTYKLVIEAEMVNHGKGSFGDMPMRATFKVKSVRSAGASSAPTPPPPATRNDKVAVLANKASTA